MKMKKEDKALIKAFFNWTRERKEGYPTEYECSNLIRNMNTDHRWLVEEYIDKLIADCK